MKKRIIILLCVFALTLLATQAFAEYDQKKVIDVMRKNGAAMGAINKALGNEDFFSVAENLMTIATGMKSLEGMEPPKGPTEEWDANHSALIKSALKGIGACGEEDAEKVGMYVGEIGKLIQKGHGMFK